MIQAYPRLQRQILSELGLKPKNSTSEAQILSQQSYCLTQLELIVSRKFVLYLRTEVKEDNIFFPRSFCPWDSACQWRNGLPLINVPGRFSINHDPRAGAQTARHDGSGPRGSAASIIPLGPLQTGAFMWRQTLVQASQERPLPPLLVQERAAAWGLNNPGLTRQIHSHTVVWNLSTPQLSV